MALLQIALERHVFLLDLIELQWDIEESTATNNGGGERDFFEEGENEGNLHDDDGHEDIGETKSMSCRESEFAMALGEYLALIEDIFRSPSVIKIGKFPKIIFTHLSIGKRTTVWLWVWVPFSFYDRIIRHRLLLQISHQVLAYKKISNVYSVPSRSTVPLI